MYFNSIYNMKISKYLYKFVVHDEGFWFLIQIIQVLYHFIDKLHLLD